MGWDGTGQDGRTNEVCVTSELWERWMYVPVGRADGVVLVKLRQCTLFMIYL